MPAKKWMARIHWWRGKISKPRKNQIVSSRIIKAKTIEDLARKLAGARKRSWQLIESGGRQDPGCYFTKLLEKKMLELSRTEKELFIAAILNSLPTKPDADTAHRLSLALAKLSMKDLRVLVEHFRVPHHDLQSTQSSIS
jgi:hypothetical protein